MSAVGNRPDKRLPPRPGPPRPARRALPREQIQAGKWPGMYTSKVPLTLTKNRLPESTTALFVGRPAQGSGSMPQYPESNW
jgi:hypothetical protein